MRKLICQIDADGCGNLEHSRMVKTLIEKYPKIKFDASAIVCYFNGTLNDQIQGPLTKTFREIFALPNVEVCSHSFSHPMNWRDPWSSGLVPNQEWSNEKEILYSTDFIDHYLAPSTKKCEVFLLTGNCNPTSDQLKMMWDRGLYPMNAGFESLYPYTFIDGQIQYNQRAWHDCWHTQVRKYRGDGTAYVPKPYGYKKVVEYFIEHPERPVHVYFHVYCAMFPETYESVDYVLKWASQQNLEPMYLTEYIRQFGELER